MSKENIRKRGIPKGSTHLASNRHNMTINDLVDETSKEMCQEAIQYFNKNKGIRKCTDSARFFFKDSEVQIVLNGLKNIDSVTVEIEKDDKGNFFCYKIDCKRNFEK